MNKPLSRQAWLLIALCLFVGSTIIQDESLLAESLSIAFFVGGFTALLFGLLTKEKF